MITHDFSRPIPPGTLRISVLADDELFAADFPTAKLSVTLKAFADHAGLDTSEASSPQASQRCKATAAAAAVDGDTHLVTVGALWLFLRQPGGQAEMNGDRLTSMIRDHGACMLTVTAPAAPGDKWDFRLFAMPRWPTSVRPYRATQRDLRRRWR
jgi:hypothetical protein